MFCFRCCGTRSKTIHDVSSYTFNLSHEESSTFCSDEEYNITVSTKIKCKEKAKIYQLDQYDLHNDDGKGSVQIMKNSKKSLRNDQPIPKPVFEFELSSNHYCVSFKCPTKCGLMEKFNNVT